MARKSPPQAAGPAARSDDLVQRGRKAWRLFLDPRVPVAYKVLPLAIMAGYLVFPLDIVPDFVPVLGQLDDLAVLLIALRVFVNLAEGQAGAGGDEDEADEAEAAITTSYRVRDEAD